MVQPAEGAYRRCARVEDMSRLSLNQWTVRNWGVRAAVDGCARHGIEAFTDRNPLAWPSFATFDDVTGFPPTVISVNECDPLRDEGINFYRLLLDSGVPARCRESLGTCHGTEVLPVVCPDISHATASDIATFASSL